MASHAMFRAPEARNEPVRDYIPGSRERASLQLRLEQMRSERIEIPVVIGGKDVGTEQTKPAVMPHDKEHVLADVHQAGAEQVQQAIDAAAAAWEDWSRWPWEDRAVTKRCCARPRRPGCLRRPAQVSGAGYRARRAGRR